MMMKRIGTNQKMLVVCVKYSDVSTTRLAKASDWITLLNSQVNHFYNQTTFNNTNFTFELPTGGPADANGWFTLSYKRGTSSFEKMGQDVIDLVDKYVDFTKYNGILVITNFPDFGGQTQNNNWWETTEGSEATMLKTKMLKTKKVDGVGKKKKKVAVRVRQMGLSMVDEWLAHSFGMTYDEAAAVAAHEIGHQLDTPTHYSNLAGWPGTSRDSISTWDVMGLSPFQHHFLGWAKATQGWLPKDRIQNIKVPGPDRDETITLSPLEVDGGAVQLIRIPFFETIYSKPLGGGTVEFPFVGYIVENRQRVNGDEGLASSGVLVSLVNENPDIFYGSKAIVMDKKSSTGTLDDAALQVGDSYSDAAHNINISVLKQIRNNYNVRVTYKSPPGPKPNLMITPWGAPPFISPDIWVDSEKNGWGTYRYTDSTGNPSGQGDAAWVNHINRIYVRVYNLGPGLATNVRVQVFENSPPGIGDAGKDWNPIGTILFPSIAGGGSAQDFVPWTPTVGAHTCIRAVVEEVPGELGTANHKAQTNVSLFDTSAKSPWKPVSLKIQVYNSNKDAKIPVYFNFYDIPKDWAIEIVPRRLTIPPNGRRWVKFAIYPSGASKTGKNNNGNNGQYQVGFIGKPKIEANVPFADTFVPIGGVELWTHLVTATKLTCVPKRSREKVTVAGRLDPVFSGATIAVELTSKGKRLLQYTKTEEDGRYIVFLQGLDKGVWNAQAFFDGDIIHGAAQSSLRRFPGKYTNRRL